MPALLRRLSPRCGSKLHLHFDDTLPFGAKDHFFHFFHGYLIPGLALSRAAGVRRVSFEACGPLMTPKLAEACALAGLRLQPAPPPEAEEPNTAARVVPRWDELLYRTDSTHQTPDDIRAFHALPGDLRDLLLTRAQKACKARGTLDTWQRTDLLVLKRSPEHPYYAPGGAARLSGYGRGRRALLNTAEIAEHLAGCGHRVREIDLGTLPLWDQIMAFRHADLVIGARGAEFAHLFWMRPGTTAMMFATPLQPENNASRSLAEIFQLRFIAPKVDDHLFSVLPEQVCAYLA